MRDRIAWFFFGNRMLKSLNQFSLDCKTDSPEEMFRKWRRAFRLSMRYLGIGRRAANKLFWWGNYHHDHGPSGYSGWGHNWKRLHMTDEEAAWSAEECRRCLSWETMYSSDRMTFDRLFRRHWLFGCCMHKLINNRNA